MGSEPLCLLGSTDSKLTVDDGAQEDAQTVLWHAAGPGIGENFSDSYLNVAQFLNPALS